MASRFLQKRFPKLLTERAGKATVKYYAFDPSAVDELTGDVDEATAYSNMCIVISALVTFDPSRALRDKLGLEQSFDAVLLLSQQQVSEANITIKIGDAFELPKDDDRYEVRKTVISGQTKDSFLYLIVAVSRRTGRR